MMTKQFTTDVLICGAGAAGLTLAVDLARRGVTFRLIEMRTEPFSGSRGKCIQPRTLEVFEDFGIVDRVMASGGYYPPRREYHDSESYEDKPIYEVSDPTPAEPYRTSIMVPQFLTEAALRERLTELGCHVEFGCALTGLQQDGEGVTATIARASGEEVIDVRYLVGTDGGRSFVRHALNLEFPGKTLGVRAIVADVMVTGIGRNVWHRFDGDQQVKQLFLCPLVGTELIQLQAPIPLEGDVDLSAEGLTALVAERSGRPDIIVREVSWASAYNMNARLAERYRDGRVFLAGDAAHIHPPTGGQGLNTGVQDAYNLGWKLAAALRGAPDAILDSYQEERRPVAAAMLGLATKLLDSTKAGSSMQRGREVNQLDLSYPASPLSLEMPARQGGILAGDRAPDAPIRGASGQPSRLFNLFKGPHWTLIGYEVDRLSEIAPRAGLHIHAVGARGDIVDDGGHIRDAYDVTTGDWVLVRPDGYVGGIVPPDHIAPLESYLDGMGLTTG